jgi:hypothetical protein
MRRALDAVDDHLADRRRGVVRVVRAAVVGLQQAWVADAVVGVVHADAGFGFLEYGRQDEAGVDRGGFGDLEDGCVDVVEFGGAVLGMGLVLVR